MIPFEVMPKLTSHPVMLVVLLAVFALSSPLSLAAETPPLERLLALLGAEREAILNSLTGELTDTDIPALLEIVSVSRDPALNRRLIDHLEATTKKSFGYDLERWFRWWWNRDIPTAPSYADFKARLYARIDPSFERYFSAERDAAIRLDEIRWGGVGRDGIPPLRDPKLVAASDAELDGGDVIFGFEIRGEARAYPKRILAWHEMAVETVAGVPIAAVYCTLCGTVIVYDTRSSQDGETTVHAMGTSGFLYRSNKLMYDQATFSLWSTLRGEPVVGPLVGRGIRLAQYPVVTTTWKEWKRRHPDTKVLSFDTGHDRDYGEGVAYRSYFASDDLMFTVPTGEDPARDRALRNKDDVLAIRAPDPTDPPLAIAVSFLETHPIHHDRVGGLEIVVLTDRSGAARVYASAGLRLKQWNRKDTATDPAGIRWTVTEAALLAEDGTMRRERVAAHRVFWFGWRAAEPETRLVR